MVDKVLSKKILKSISYVFMFFGAYFGTDKIEKNNDVKYGIDQFTKIGIIPLLLCAFIWHTFLNGSIIKTSTPFFEIECGGANLGIAVGLIMSYLLKLDTKTRCCLLSVFLVYMLVALYCQITYHNSFMQRFSSIPLIIILMYFIKKGLDSEKDI